MLNAPALVGEPDGDYLPSARVSVGCASTFDAGLLVLYPGERSWVKLCFEYSPAGESMVVSVVTRGVSDDCNSVVVESSSVWLRIPRLGAAHVVHASTDGSSWRFVRYFSLGGGAEPGVGFEAQSPAGDGCTVTFEQIRFEPRRLEDLRDGS